MALLTQIPRQVTPQDGAVRVKRVLQQTFHQIETNLAFVRQAIERHGRSEINAALGSDANELPQIYEDLKSLLIKYRSDKSIEELPK